MGDRVCGKSYLIRNHTDIIYIMHDKIYANRKCRLGFCTSISKFLEPIEKLDIPQLKGKFFAVDYTDFYFNRDRFLKAIKKIIDNQQDLKLVILCNIREYTEMVDKGYVQRLKDLYIKSIDRDFEVRGL